MAKGSLDHGKVAWSLTGLLGMLGNGGEGEKVVDEPHSGLGHVESRWHVQESKRYIPKCKVQTLYSPGIAQGCVVVYDT